MHRHIMLMSALVLSAAACSEGPLTSSVEQTVFGVTSQGDTAHLYTLRNGTGMEARVTDFGGIIVSLAVPDRNGSPGDIVLGYDSLPGYLEESPYFGALIGRYGNRIAGGTFTLDGQRYELATNNGPNHLHGGLQGFDKVLWHAEPFENDSASGLVLTYTSPAGEEGYPGTLDARVTYTLTQGNEIVFEYFATTDVATPVNLTQHSYFNLGGHGSGDILDQQVMINADAFTPVDSTLIPTGEIRSVDGTPFDFRTPTAIGARIGQENTQLAYGGGYDHNWVLNRPAGDRGLVLAARVHDPVSGRVMEIHTTEPGLQFYSGNFLDGTIQGKDGVVYEHRTGFAMETQHFPDSPNQPGFPSTILRPGDEYRSLTVYRFSVDG